MAYYATFSNVQDDADDPEFGPEERAKRVVRMASNMVSTLVEEPPEPWPEEFRLGARDATIAVFWWLWETKGYVGTERSITGSSISYQNDPAVLQLVSDAMGEFAKGAGFTGLPSAGGLASDGTYFSKGMHDFLPSEELRR